MHALGFFSFTVKSCNIGVDVYMCIVPYTSTTVCCTGVSRHSSRWWQCGTASNCTRPQRSTRQRTSRTTACRSSPATG